MQTNIDIPGSQSYHLVTDQISFRELTVLYPSQYDSDYFSSIQKSDYLFTWKIVIFFNLHQKIPLLLKGQIIYY